MAGGERADAYRGSDLVTPRANPDSRTDSASTARAALARTVLLLRDHVRADVSEEIITETLTTVRVVIAADRPNATTVAAQNAIVATALLVARSGGQVSLELPDGVPLLDAQAPLRGDRLRPAIEAVLADLIPGVTHGTVAHPRRAFDLAIVIGDTRWQGPADRVVRLQADAWAGALETGGSGTRWDNFGSPFGPLAAAGLAAGEAFKAAVSSLRRAAIDPFAFELLFAPSPSPLVRLAPAGAPLPTRNLGHFDLISGGAIIQSALYVLGRIPGVVGQGRVIEPERGDITNLNRYALLLRSRRHALKAEDLAAWSREGGLGGLRLKPIVARYDAGLAIAISPHAPAVLVGVDDIPSRWVVQAHEPEWLGVGATTHYMSVASYHRRGTGCARCLHPEDDPGGGPIPTAAFVSHWAGLWLATMFVRARTGMPMPLEQQSVFMTSLRAESAVATWFAPVPVRGDCSCRRVA